VAPDITEVAPNENRSPQETARSWASRPADRAARVAEKVRQAQATLAAEVAALCSGEDWKAYLALQARLHAYSPNNVMLIALQHAEAYRAGAVATAEPGVVAGFHTWKSLGRSVDKGQHGYVVLAPCRYDRRVATDPSGAERRLGAREQPAPGERVEHQRVLAGFRVEHVFELSQTSGAPLPEPPRPKLLEGAAPAGLWEATTRLLEARGLSVSLVPDAPAIGGANGVTSFAQGSVSVRADMDEAARMKTLLHEAAHVLLHGEAPGRQLPRPLKEVEAESVAFVVAAAHGMSTAEYSFPYVSIWAGGDGAKAVQATQARVGDAARVLIEASPAEHLVGGKAVALRPEVAAELRAAPQQALAARGGRWPSGDRSLDEGRQAVRASELEL
jgi:hypothetical protein